MIRSTNLHIVVECLSIFIVGFWRLVAANAFWMLHFSLLILMHYGCCILEVANTGGFFRLRFEISDAVAFWKLLTLMNFRSCISEVAEDDAFLDVAFWRC